MSFVIVFTNCPDEKSAKQIAEALLGEKLAACINIMPKGLSMYRWNGEVESAEEHMMLIKTRQDRYPDVEMMIQEFHPYELPEIITVPITSGLPAYFGWLDENSVK